MGSGERGMGSGERGMGEWRARDGGVESEGWGSGERGTGEWRQMVETAVKLDQ